ncbi:Fc.00g048200.m01.CDS01 [Cosmosporella sp. VM-42]
MDVEGLIEQLTLDEKVTLTSGDGWWHTTAIDRLSIPSIRLSDGPNGVRGTHFFDSTPSACLPCGTALGATFDTKIAERIGRLLSDEAHAKGAHVILGPTVNIQRSPLGGRGFESISEDPILSGIIAGHYVRGLQESGVTATLKHFVCNDMESERMAADSLVTTRALREIYLLPFMIAIEIGQPRAVMTSYGKVNGCHVAENQHILQDILRDEWKWDGLVMSDWYGTYSTSEAINAGLDLEMPGPSRWRGEALNLAVASNKVKPFTLDQRVRNVLDLIKHGLENTSIPTKAPERQLNTPKHIALMRDAAAQSIVLLKNERHILPFNPSKRVAVIGPNANISTYCGGGSAGLRAYKAVTPLEGIKDLATNVVFSQGTYGHQSLPQLGKLLKTSDGKQGFQLRVYNDPPPTKGANARQIVEERILDDTNMWFVDYRNPNLSDTWYAEAEGTLVPETAGEWEFGLAVHGTAKLFINGELVVSNVEKQRSGKSFLGCGTVEETGSLTLEAGKLYQIIVQWGCATTSNLKVLGAVDFGQGGLRFSGCPKLDPVAALNKAVEVARSSDQVVICAGLSGERESEGQDRTHMGLPPGTDELIEAVIAVNRNTAVVIQSGTPVSMPWIERAGAVLQAWFGGNEAGNGIADVLFGAVNPAAKLPLTMPRRLADNPAALSFRSENGRVLYSEDVYVGYRWYDTLEIEPLFAFGHGLSYTTFELSDLEISPVTQINGRTNGCTIGHVNGFTNSRDIGLISNHSDEVDSGLLIIGDAEELLVRVRVTNHGFLAGSEVVQLYVKPAASTPLTSSTRERITRPTKELKGFAKVHTGPGDTKTGEIKLDLLRATSYWSEMEDCWRSDAGIYCILVGTSSRGLDGASPGIPNQYVSPSISDLPFPTDELCSRALLDIVIGDYLDRIYPLVPVIHRPSFRADLTSNRDRTDPDFLSLVISIAALTVGLLPSRFLDYRAMAPDIAMRFETRTAMINCCSDMCMRLRTHTYWDHISQRKWAACYLLSIAFFQTGQTNRSRMHEVESLQIGRLLGLHRISDYVGLNCIETQLRKKAFWLSFYTYAHSTLQSGRRERLAFLDHSMLHEVNFEALLPREDDDEQILEDQILSPLSLIASPPVPGSESEPRSSVFTLTTGFIFHSRLFLKGLEEAVSPENCDCAHRQNPSLKLSRLRKLLHEIRYLLDEVPGPMRQWASADILDTADHPSPGVNSNPCSPMPQLSNQYRKSADQHYGTSKVFLGQAEIMRANLHGTHLWLQSLLLDQIDALLQGTASTDDSTTGENSSMAVLKSNWTEREDICRQMLHLLHSIPFAHLEPNGLYLVFYIQ